MYPIFASDHDFSFELPFLIQGEAGCSTILETDFRPPQDLLGCPACERRCSAALLHAASSTVAPPTFVRWAPWPPHYGRDETLIAHSPAAIPDQISRPPGRPPPVGDASGTCGRSLTCGRDLSLL